MRDIRHYPEGWLGAELLASAGIWSMQTTLPLYINQLSPTQIRNWVPLPMS